MINYPNLIPECNVDTVFVEMCGYKQPNHAYSITQVSSILETSMAKKRAMGFVDNDKRQPKYFKKFKEIDSTNNAKLLKHPDKEHYLVVVHPAMDKFIFKLCQELEINLPSYNLPKEYGAFVAVTKKDSIKKNSHFKNLLNTIHQKNPTEIKKIKSWVTKYSLAEIKK